MANEGNPANPSLNGAQILAKLLALGALGLSVPDNVFAIVGSGDATKIARFEVDGITTGTTRVYTLPDASITVAGINLAQTWTATQSFAVVNVSGPLTVAAAGATSNPLVVIGPTGAGSTEVNQALRIGNISATGKYLAMGYDSTNDYAYIAGIQAATGWLPVRINPYASAACSINAGGGATTIGGTLGVTGVASFTNTTDSSDSATAAVVLSGGLAMAKSLWVGAAGAGGTSVSVNCAAANGAYFKMLSANVLRWQFGRVGTSHDWRIEGYDSSGVLTDIPLTIANAAGGAFTIVRPITATSTLAVTGTGSFGDTLTVSKDQAGVYTHFDVVNPNAGGYAQTNLTAQGKTAGTNWAPGLFYKFTTSTTDPMVFEINSAEVGRWETTGLTIASGGVLQLGNAYVATPPTCTGYVTVKDSGGTTYKVLVST